MTNKRICLWSSPRNLSTALMYSFAQRPDTIVFDEPLYAHYLRVTNADHPGKEEIMQSQQQDGEKVVTDVILANYDKEVVFFKQMTHHLVALDEAFLGKTENIVYIRDPKQIISSYAQVRPEVNMVDVGIEKQWHLYNDLLEKGLKPVVLDSAALLQSPREVLKKLCEAMQISFYEEMLSWPAGPKKEDGIWAKYWYNNVHKSTRFEKQETSERALPEYLEPLYKLCKGYYDKLFIHAIKA